MALTKVTKQGIGADAIDATKIGDDSISDEHLDVTALTGHTELSAQAADDDILLVYDTSAGVLKKIQASNVGTAAVTLTSISPTNVTTGDGTGNATFTITGKNFASGSTAVLVTASGSEVSFASLTRDSSTQFTGVIAISSLSNANEPYDIRVYGANGTSATLRDQVNIDAQPVYNTAAGSLASIEDGARGSTTITIEAYDPDSAGNVTFELQSGSLPAGASATTVNENGVSKYQISGFSGVLSDTTTNFVLRAVDAASNTSSRSFSITVNSPKVETFTASGTFSVPSGITSVDVLVVAGGGGGANQGGGYAGGGGGAGGLIFFPGYPVTPGGTVSVTVGCGGGTYTCSPYSAGGGFGIAGQDSVFGTLTAKGGGAAGTTNGPAGSGGGYPGGSGGGAGGRENAAGGCATQGTQPGNSGAYGFGNYGGRAANTFSSGINGGGGGGGAGATGQNAGNGYGGNGGIGKAYTIADGTTPVYYAGGGGGSGPYNPDAPAPGAKGTGGQGGGGNGVCHVTTGGPGLTSATAAAQAGQANKGGGGGSGAYNDLACNSAYDGSLGAPGGKGIVIVRWA